MNTYMEGTKRVKLLRCQEHVKSQTHIETDKFVNYHIAE